ncbi:hypothetical protein K456DRAFT_1147440 [Colletotrichum gloeosporioides 23]|nr:hypothetical protein K456DRAFT_1147440 [Colletotrichum gloeosporioides 23]
MVARTSNCNANRVQGSQAPPLSARSHCDQTASSGGPRSLRRLLKPTGSQPAPKGKPPTHSQVSLPQKPSQSGKIDGPGPCLTDISSRPSHTQEELVAFLFSDVVPGLARVSVSDEFYCYYFVSAGWQARNPHAGRKATFQLSQLPRGRV